MADQAVRTGDRPTRGVVRLSLHQFRFDLSAFLRNGQSRFFTLALPVIFLLIFSTIFGGSNHTASVPGGTIPLKEFFVPSIIALGIISASFVNPVISITAQRETGVLKRRRSAPVPATAIIAGRALTAGVTALFTTAVLLAIGWVAFRAHVPAHTAPALVVDVVVGTIAFCCLGYALASVIHDQDSAQPITQAVVLPLYFISGVFIDTASLPRWLVHVADVFPVRHLAHALLIAYDPHTAGAGLSVGDLLAIAAWGAGGLAVAVWRFSWLPKGS
jgi:ABC-2 type transport system permease protein